jgi:hypothetical protein
MIIMMLLRHFFIPKMEQIPVQPADSPELNIGKTEPIIN